MKDAELEKRALSGDAEAQYQMGKFYHYTNEGLAREWYNKAIEQNYEDAIIELALLNEDADTIDEFAERLHGLCGYEENDFQYPYLLHESRIDEIAKQL